MTFNRFLELSVFSPEEWTPREISEVISWQGHIPFAFSLIRILNPSFLVELGTHKGDSYLAFCEAVKRFALSTKCFAVDTWAGDEHSGYYGSEVFEQLRLIHDQRYGHFSTLIPSTFDEALSRFNDRSVDLLHIDGFHTYEAVRHDFETWHGKLSDRGIVLFHDTQVREADFGVWKLWEELSSQYPHFEFLHSNGLGVLAIGTEASAMLPDLFDTDSETINRIRKLYSTLGDSIAFQGLYKLLISEREISRSEITSLRNIQAERDQQLDVVSRQLVKREEQLDVVSQQLAERDGQLDILSRQLAERDGQLVIANQTLDAITNSTTWKATEPLRYAVTIFRFAIGQPKGAIIAFLRKIYHTLPVSSLKRNQLKSWAYRWVPGLFSKTLSYSLWQSQNGGEFPVTIQMEQPKDIGEPFEVRSPESPVVSIIIPVYGKIEYTYRCLRSLWSHQTRYSFEIIVVDDQSPDKTQEVLQQIKGIRVFHNRSNLGFIRSCNLGAAHARGKLLVMLNNDTVVRPGWLDELVETFNCIPQAGLVGSKLIYPDGRLQEAGGIIWSDGSGWNYGRLQDPNRPEFSYLRDVDYCSGASLMITTDLFNLLGGFDEHYLPAYGEDSDLAFRVRQQGYRVLYQPLSMAIHFEGISSGKETSGGVKSFQVRNAKKLYDRWQKLLESHGRPGKMPELAKDRGISGRALVLDHCTPTPDQDAGSITALNLMRILQGLGFKVTFIPEDNFLYMTPYTLNLQRIGIECLYGPYVTSVEKHLAEFGKHYDIIVVFRMTAAERNFSAIRKYCPNAKLIFHTSDLHHLREFREAELADSDQLRQKAIKTRERELRIIQGADATIVHSLAEKEMLDAEPALEANGGRIFLFPWAIEIPGTKVPFEKRNGMVFIGGFQHQPNIDAVLYFSKEVFPRIRQKLPEAVFRIVGSRGTPEIFALAEKDGIEVLGFVEDLQPVLDSCRLSVVPMRYGAGIKGKIGTSLSYGLPCVSTKIGAEGMGLSSGDGVIIADSPETFADEVVRLHQDPVLWKSSSTGGIDFVSRNYSLASGRHIVKALLQQIGVPQNKFSDKKIHCLYGNENLELFSADQADNSFEILNHIQCKKEYDKWVVTSIPNACRKREKQILDKYKQTKTFCLPGFCRVCEREVDFLIDFKFPSTLRSQENRVPNWPETIICPECRLSNQQRALAFAISQIEKHYRDKRMDIYLMERNSPFYQWISNSNMAANITGSECFGDELDSGKLVKAIRHKNAEQLSFANNTFDLVISNNTLEHVLNPQSALFELYRVLKPQGQLLITVPFYLDKEKTECRAELINGKLNHIMSPVYRHNHFSGKKSLVLYDFGWDFFHEIKSAGFSKVELCLYWSEIYGHLGEGQYYIHAVKG